MCLGGPLKPHPRRVGHEAPSARSQPHLRHDQPKAGRGQYLRGGESVLDASRAHPEQASEIGKRLAEAAKIAKDKGLPGYVSLQPHYNLLERPLFEGPLEDECVKEGIGVIPYWPLAAGFLSGKYRSEADLGKSPRGPGLKKYLNDKGLAVLKALDAAGKKHNASNVTVALAWLMQRKSITAPIVSATSLEQLKTLIAAPALKLDAESVAALDKASA